MIPFKMYWYFPPRVNHVHLNIKQSPEKRKKKTLTQTSRLLPYQCKIKCMLIWVILGRITPCICGDSSHPLCIIKSQPSAARQNIASTARLPHQITGLPRRYTLYSVSLVPENRCPWNLKNRITVWLGIDICGKNWEPLRIIISGMIYSLCIQKHDNINNNL